MEAASEEEARTRGVHDSTRAQAPAQRDLRVLTTSKQYVLATELKQESSTAKDL